MARRVAYLVAPYSPLGRSALVHLGAAKKIAAVIGVLASLGYRVRLINSAHNAAEFRTHQLRRSTIGGVRLLELTPFTVPWRPLGKVLNLCSAYRWGRRLARRQRQSLVWIYNGYAFESLFALCSGKHSRLVVELEDLPFSRRRGGLDLKNRLDSALLSRVLTQACLVTAVNEMIAASLPGLRCRVVSLPSILDPGVEGRAFKRPFSGSPYRIGYFGGLTVEKGANVLLSLAEDLPANWSMLVTGSGPLASRFREASARVDRVSFRESASDSEVLSLMGECDLLVNPHTSIAAMRDGVFPFKVYEYVSTGRLVASTPLPPAGVDLGAAAVWFDGSAGGLRRLLETAATAYEGRRTAIALAAAEVRLRYAPASVAGVIQRALS